MNTASGIIKTTRSNNKASLQRQHKSLVCAKSANVEKWGTFSRSISTFVTFFVHGLAHCVLEERPKDFL